MSQQALAAQDESPDGKVVRLWLHGRSKHTIRAYRRDVAAFLGFVGKSLAEVTLADLQAFADALNTKDASKARTLAAIKSLFSFAAQMGYCRFNVGAALRKPKSADTLPDRILDEASVLLMVRQTQGRDHALVRLLYAGGFRVSEVISLRWKNIASAADGSAFVTVFGKGGKTRTVRISKATASVLHSLRVDAGDDDFVFQGRAGHLDASQAWRIVRKAAIVAGIERAVSPHFLRHAHASHAIDKGVKITTVRDTLGHASIATTNRYAHARPDDSSGLVLNV